MGEMDLKKAEYYTNRELSWLGFNNRILGEARDASLPLFERLKFLSITASNLDEFFMIRVASLKDMVHAGYTKKDISTILGRTDGTCTVAKSSVLCFSLPSFLQIRAPIFRVLLRISGNGLEESIAIGVRTG